VRSFFAWMTSISGAISAGSMLAGAVINLPMLEQRNRMGLMARLWWQQR
jgi:hypothetical protein